MINAFESRAVRDRIFAYNEHSNSISRTQFVPRNWISALAELVFGDGITDSMYDLSLRKREGMTLC